MTPIPEDKPSAYGFTIMRRAIQNCKFPVSQWLHSPFGAVQDALFKQTLFRRVDCFLFDVQHGD
jgi:hypothetical protein